MIGDVPDSPVPSTQPDSPGIIIRNATIVTMNDRFDIVEGGVLVRGGRIVAIGPHVESAAGETIIDAAGGYLLPGFVQTHIHLCQTLFRGSADDMPLLEWLKRRVWPMEAAHTPATLRASVRLAAAELLLSGTTCVLTMETVHDTDVVFETLVETGMRAFVGKCMMDGSSDAPPRLHEKTTRSIDESLALKKRWDGAAKNRLHAVFAPRFAVSCTRELLEGIADLSSREDAIVHTHASESRDEVEEVRRLSGGFSNLEYLADIGLATSRLCAAHCVWVTDHEQTVLAERGVKVLHCPGSNLKLGSGLAPIAEMRRRGISVSLGADGAACNNRLDMFEEIRLAALIQSVRGAPGALTARDAVWMATREGARAVGLDNEIGSIELGARDLLRHVRKEILDCSGTPQEGFDLRRRSHRLPFREQLVHIQAIAEIGWNPACGSMRLPHVPQFLESGHDVSKGGGRHTKATVSKPKR